MADAFRGLTIRLGADARPLNSAINSISSSAAAAQKQLNRLNKAAKFDGANAKMMESRIDLMGDKAMHSAKAFEKIKTAMRQTAAESAKLKSTFSGKGFGELVKGTTDAHYATQKLRDELYTVDASLQHMYDSMARVVMRSKELGNTDDVLKSAAMRMKGLSDEGAAEYIQKLKNEMKGTGEAAEKAKAEFKELVAGVHNQDAINYVKKLGDEMRGDGEAAKEAKAKFKELMTEAASSSGLAEKFGKEKHEVEALMGVYDRLREHHKALSAEQKTMNAVEGYRSMRLEAQAYKAELRQTVAETARLKSELYALGTGGKLMSAVNQISALDEATDKAVANAHQMIEAYRAAPQSLDAAVGKIKAVSAAEETLRVRTEAIKSAMNRIKDDPAFDKMAASSKEAYTEAVRVEQKYTQLGSALKMVTAKLDDLEKAQRDMNNRGVSKTSAEYQKVAKSIQLAKNGISELNARMSKLSGDHQVAALAIQFRELETQMASATTQAAALHTQVSRLRAVSNIGKSFREFGFGMYASLTPAIMMAGRYAVQAAEDTDKAYRDMRKTVNGTEEQFEHLKDAALDFSRTHVTSAETMLEIEAMGGQLGIQVENLESFAHTVSNLDIATNMQSDDIATMLGKFATVMGMSEDEYDKFGDALVRLGNNMPALEGDVMTITSRFMGMGKVVGMSADEMLAWSTAATATGQLPYAAGSSMQRFINAVNLAVSENGDALKEWASVANMSSEEFAQAFRSDASGALYSVIEGLGQMQRTGGDVGGELKKLGVNTVQFRQLLLGLTQQMANADEESNVLKQSLEMASDAYNGRDTLIHGKWEKAGDALREAERKSEGFSGAMGKMRNQATVLANELAEGAEPIVRDLSNLFGNLAGAVSDMPQGMKTATVMIGGLLAAAGPLSVGLGTTLQAVEKIVGAFGAIPRASTMAAAGLNTLNKGWLVTSERGIKANLAMQKVLGTLGTTKGMLGATAAISGVLFVLQSAIGAYEKIAEKNRVFAEATEGLTNATSNLAPKLQATEKVTLDGKTGFASSAKSVEDLIRAQSELAQSIESGNSATQNEINRLSAAKDVIDQYLNKHLDGVDAQLRFKRAVETVNEICGSQYSVIDAANGKLADERGELMKNIGAIDEYIEAKKKSLRADALSSNLTGLYSQQADAANTYMASLKELHKFEEENGADTDAYNTQQLSRWGELNRDVQESKAALDATSASISNTEAMMEDLETTAADTGNTLNSALSATGIVPSMFAADKEAYERFKQAIADYGLTTDEVRNMSAENWSAIVAEFDRGEDKMREKLNELNYHSRSALESFSAEMEAAGGSTKVLEHAAKQTGLSQDELVKSLSTAGVTAQQFASVSNEAFDKVWQASGKSVDGMTKAFALLNTIGANPVDIKINDEGLMTLNDQVITIDGNIARIGEEREFKFNVETGKFDEINTKIDETQENADEGADLEVDASVEGGEEAAANIDEIKQEAGEGAEMEVGVNSDALKSLIGDMFSSGELSLNASINFTSEGAEEANSKWTTLKESVEAGATGDVKIAYDSVTSAQSAVDSLKSSVKSGAVGKVEMSVSGNALSNIGKSVSMKADASQVDAGAAKARSALASIKDKRVVITAVDNATSRISSIKRAIDSLPTSKTSSIYVNTYRTTYEKTVKQSATGGVSRVPLNIPRNAAGGINGIATRAILTNQGYVGEDGSEALISMGRRNAIVPLSNRRYVRPFARAVASEMGGLSGGSQVVNKYYSVGNVSFPEGSDGARALEALYSALKVEEAV